MDNNHSNSGEKTALIITIIIIVFAVLYLLYVLFLSNRNITNNIKNTTNDIKNGIDNTTNNIYDETNNLKNDVKNGVDDVKNDVKNSVNDVRNGAKADNENETASLKEEIEIGTFTTNIYDKDEGRIFNISLANTKLNDTIVKQGEEFSFINTVGTMGEAEGYKKTLGFDSQGKNIKIAGGGLCQLSSTLYNAVLNAGLEIVERHAHSKRVYYVPKDRDATVCYPSLDFKFRNNSDGDIKINATNDNNNVTIKLTKIKETKSP